MSLVAVLHCTSHTVSDDKSFKDVSSVHRRDLYTTPKQGSLRAVRSSLRRLHANARSTGIERKHICCRCCWVKVKNREIVLPRQLKQMKTPVSVQSVQISSKVRHCAPFRPRSGAAAAATLSNQSKASSSPPFPHSLAYAIMTPSEHVVLIIRQWVNHSQSAAHLVDTVYTAWVVPFLVYAISIGSWS